MRPYPKTLKKERTFFWLIIVSVIILIFSTMSENNYDFSIFLEKFEGLWASFLGRMRFFLQKVEIHKLVEEIVKRLFGL